MPRKKRKSTTVSIPPPLLERLREGRCILFAGAGLSAQAATAEGSHPPTWSALLEEMIDWSATHNVLQGTAPDELRQVLNRGRYLVVAQELQTRLGRELCTCLGELLHSGETKPSEAHRLLPQLPFAAALTTNYDSLLEGAYAAAWQGTLPQAFTLSGINQALDCLRNDRFFRFKLHGDLSEPDTIVFGNRDYSRLQYQVPAYRSFLEAIFSAYTVIFVGFGANDPDLDGILDRLSTIYERTIGQHYLLISSEHFTTLERRRLFEDRRLDCVLYEADSMHTQVKGFLNLAINELGKSTKRLVRNLSVERPRAFISGSWEKWGHNRASSASELAVTLVKEEDAKHQELPVSVAIGSPYQQADVIVEGFERAGRDRVPEVAVSTTKRH